MAFDPLFYIIRARGQGSLFPESKVMTWFVQIALGLHYMHTNRVLHRDIKTQNVFILSSGRVVLGDFGISKVMGNKKWEGEYWRCTFEHVYCFFTYYDRMRGNLSSN